MSAVTIYLAAMPLWPVRGWRDENGLLRIGQPGINESRPLTKYEVASWEFVATKGGAA
jgi:hypothetical protein